MLLTGKNFVPDKLMWLFTADERFVDARKLAAYESSDTEVLDESLAISEILTYRTTVGVLRSRLFLQGFSTEFVTRNAIALLESELEDPDGPIREIWRETANELGPAERHLKVMVRHRRRQSNHWGIVAANERERYLESRWEDLCEAFDDPRFELSLLLAPAKSATVAVLDLSDPLLGGYLEIDDVHHEIAQLRLANEVAASGPIIVVTEGGTDAQIIRRSVELADPEIASFFRFLDFDNYSAPGGTDRVVSLTRGLAAAGVMNRVLAVVDNDTAGRQAERTLLQSNLPSRMRIARLPDVDYGRNFGTIGPTGRASSDINGRAVSIELMFGLELLTSASGGAEPLVRWTGYIQALDDYQGTICAKRDIQEAIRRHLKVQKIEYLDPAIAAGCHRLSDLLKRSAAHATPTMASEYSSLMTGRFATVIEEREGK